MNRLFLPLAAFALAAGPALAQSSDLAPVSSAPAIKAVDGIGVPLGDMNSLALLYDNGPLVTGTGNGFGGANTSAIGSAYGANSYGSNHNPAAAAASGGPFYVADDFVVPAGGWTISDMEFFSYQTGTGATPTTSTFTGLFVQIWNGRPGDAGSTVIFGDLTNNRLASSTFSNIYRVTTTTLTNNLRPLFRNVATIGTTLAAGTYWVQWGTTGSLASGPWAPPITGTGATPPAGNALQFTTGAWAPILDGGVAPAPGTIPSDMAFVVNGTAGTPAGPVLSATPTALSFGTTTPVGTPSAAQTVTLSNPGTAPLTITSITGSGAPFTVNTTGTLLTLAAGGTTTFTVTFTPTNAAAATGTVTILSNAPSSPTTIALTGTGMAPPPDGTYPSADTPIAITDNAPAGITSTITIPATVAGTITDLDVDLNITHTWDGDVIANLTKGAVASSLVDRPGVPVTSTVGCNGDNIVIIHDDQGTAGAVETSCVPGGPGYTTGGRYTPNTPLAVFNATPAAGTYTLTVSDNAGGDTGTLNSWALLVTTGGVAGEGTASTLASRLSVAPNPMRGTSQIDLTVGTSQDVRVSLYDALGREVAVLLDRSMTAGQQAYVGVSTAGLPSGVYVVRATGVDLNLTQRVTVVR